MPLKLPFDSILAPRRELEDKVIDVKLMKTLARVRHGSSLFGHQETKDQFELTHGGYSVQYKKAPKHPLLWQPVGYSNNSLAGAILIGNPYASETSV